MRFVDANIFIYALLKPKRKLTDQERQIKNGSKKILQRIHRGEEVLTSTAHVSEMVNILEDAVNLTFAISFTQDLITRWNITIEAVDKAMYILAVTLANEKKVSINDALAYIIMQRRDIEKIYSFDRHFDNLPMGKIIK